LHKALHLIHRDIKPQNILLNSSGVIKLTDFGVSGEIANTAAFAKTFVGTVKYMSPPRIKGEQHSTKSDMWSFGLVILECAIGCFPYGQTISNFFEFLNRIVTSPAPNPPADKFSEEFCNLINICLQKEEDQLPSSSVVLGLPWIQKHKDVELKEWIESFPW